ncbi:hypothetical protein GPECTOR_11g182 [Gonium pectorale]|uniref:Uncharacterized protein n=1 Tax=Gonium pectorale TaxID=33097 RepID=A0A150GPL3_GONPE|nr:hypothetical protein GPECTOR_11g182 [Gonium pectorale]|eukprot:KXZ51735.1 hypothetical protein GPECTOR_11g182 [Gonium pectorale]
MAQLSEVQQAFVQFCGVLQEFILNQQVAHSVVESLHADLPALQPEGPAGASGHGPRAAALTVTAPRGGAGGGTGAAATDVLNRLAPRLTPPAAASSASAAWSPSPASECADSYVVLQNAAFRGRELLGRLEALGGRAAEAARGDAWGPGGVQETAAARADGSAAGGVDGGGSDGCFEVDVELEAQPSGGGADADPNPAAAQAGEAAARPGAPGPAAAGAESASTSAGTQAGAAVTAAAAVAAAGVAASASAAASGGGRLSGPDLAILMGDLCRGAARELELMVRVAASVDLRTTQDDLYVYDMMLKLQPYTDERVLAAAMAQRDALAPPAAHAKAAAAAAVGARR